MGDCRYIIIKKMYAHLQLPVYSSVFNITKALQKMLIQIK